MVATRLQILQWQFRTAWGLAADIHLPRLTDEMCLWTPHPDSWTVRHSAEGHWVADWSDVDPSDPAPPSIAWLTWHVLWWWSDAISVVSGRARAVRESVGWPGSASATRGELARRADRWTALCAQLDDHQLDELVTFPWPDPRPLAFLVGWVNVELMKNIAEIGQVINMYSHRDGRELHGNG